MAFNLICFVFPTKSPLISFLISLCIWFAVAIAYYFMVAVFIRVLCARTSTKIDDLLLGIMRTPISIVIASYGLVESLAALPVAPSAYKFFLRLFYTLLTFILAYIGWKIIKLIVVSFGEKWAQKTESKVDDILIPLVDFLGPLLTVIVAILVFCSIWGLNITSVLVGAGIIGLVLGLSMQDALTNIFCGVAMLVDPAFKTGDLIILPDGKICVVERIGLRSTQLYFLNEHSLIYTPNSYLAGVMIINITKPTVDLKCNLEITVPYSQDLTKVESVLKEIVCAHPCVLGDLETKIEKLAKNIEGMKPFSNGLEIEKMESAKTKLDLERKVFQNLQRLLEMLKRLRRELALKEQDGLSREEVGEIKSRQVTPIEDEVKAVTSAVLEWSHYKDPWISEEEAQQEEERWQAQNEKLRLLWSKLLKRISRPVLGFDVILDEEVRIFADWIAKEYKPFIPPWKEPDVSFKEFGQSGIALMLEFYVNDIRLEHFQRQSRVIKEIAQQIQTRFANEGIELSVPQMKLLFDRHS